MTSSPNTPPTPGTAQTANVAAPRDAERDAVVARYSALARRAATNPPTDSTDGGDSIGGADLPGGQEVTGCGGSVYDLDGEQVPAGALAASLACGNPVTLAALHPGETVLDLGSGGGLDVLLSARRVGPHGRVYGIDASAAMLDLARTNTANPPPDTAPIEFLHGHLEQLPLPDHSVDVIISNCVLNLSTDKPRALAEAARVLRPGGRFAITDIIADPDLDPTARARAEHTVCATVGTLTEPTYRTHLLAAGFTTATLTPTHPLADGLHSATIHATTPTAPPGITIRPLRDTDATQVLALYQAGLDTGDASFETTTPTWQHFTTTKLPLHRHVALDTHTGQLLGWIAATATSNRPVYAGVIEHSLYVHPHHHNRGIGTALLQTLIHSTETAGIWTLQTGIFPENHTSLALHHRAGFREVGTRERIALHHGHWRDVTLIERRTKSTPSTPIAQ